MRPAIETDNLPNEMGRFGAYGGRFVPETLMGALEELTVAYSDARSDQSFQDELDALLKDYVGRPTPIYFARNLTAELGGAQIYLKREDLAHTGAHKINNCLGHDGPTKSIIFDCFDAPYLKPIRTGDLYGDFVKDRAEAIGENK